MTAGLPGALPADERLLWQGAPDRRLLLRDALHVRMLAAYLGLAAAAVGVAALTSGVPAGDAALRTLEAIGMGAVPVALAVIYAWLVARATVYTVTDKRLVVHIGLALPVSINLPFNRLDAADLRLRPDGSGDISVSLSGRDRLAYLVLWPHARPWRFSRAQPTLRALRDAQPVAQLLARGLAAAAAQAAPVLPEAAPGVAAAHVAPGLAA